MGVGIQPGGITVESTLGQGGGYPQAQHVLFEGQALDLPADSRPIALQPHGDAELCVIAGSLATITALVPRGDVLPESLRPKEVGLWGGGDCELLRDIHTGAMAVSSPLVVLHRSPISRTGTVGHQRLQEGVGHTGGAIDVMSPEYVFGQQEGLAGGITTIPRDSSAEHICYAALVVDCMQETHGGIRTIGRLALKPPPDVQECDAVVGFLLVDPVDLYTSIVAHNGLRPPMPTMLFVTTAVGPSVRDMPPELLSQLQRTMPGSNM